MGKREELFNELIAHQSAETKDWVIKMNQLLTQHGCKVTVDKNGNFTYASKQSNKIMCRITMNEKGCTVRPNTIHAAHSDAIQAQPPQPMLDIMQSARGCGGCAKANPAFVSCKHGGPYQFAHNGQQFESCRYVGFNFPTTDAQTRDVLEKWIEKELSHAQ